MASGHGARIWLALSTVYLVWGSTFIALAVVVRDLPPFLAMTIRHLVAGAILFAIAFPRGDRASDPIGRRQVVAAFVFGGLLFVSGHGALAWAQQTVPAGTAALLVGSIPLWMALLDRLVFGRRLPRSTYAGLVIGFIGLGVLLDPFGGGSVDRVAALVIVASALCWAIGSLYSRRAPLPTRPLVSAALGSLAGGVLLMVIATSRGELGEARFTSDAVLALGYLIVAGSLVGFTAYVWLLRSAPTSLVATYAYVNPVVAVALGWLLLGEAVTPQMGAAGVAIVASVALIVRASGRNAGQPARALARRSSPTRPASEPAS